MSTHRRAADEIPPARVVAALRADAGDDARAPVGSAPATAVQPGTRGARRAIRNAVVVGCVSMAGGTAGCTIGGPVLTIVGVLTFIAAGVMGIAAAVALSALLGHRDPRSPFDRVMLILCVILGRSPGTYLPSAQNGQGTRPGIPASPGSPAANARRAPPCSARADGLNDLGSRVQPGLRKAIRAGLSTTKRPQMNNTLVSGGGRGGSRQ
jgi:hypothetical protein